MITLISPEEEKVRFKSVREAYLKTGLNSDCIGRLTSGFKFSIYGWKSTHPRQRARYKKWRKKAGIVNLHTRELFIVQACKLKSFAREHKVSWSSLIDLSSGRLIIHRNWMMESTHNILFGENQFTKVTHFQGKTENAPMTYTAKDRVRTKYLYKNGNRVDEFGNYI
jgi:hypothetical protein